MFERNRIDRLNDSERSTGNVEVVLDDGQAMLGRLHFPATRSLGDEINNASGFIDFEVHNGDRFFLSKHAVQIIRTKQIPRADQLSRTQTKGELFNPWTVLGIAETANKDDVRDAYHRLVKQYHPDRFANLELPREVQDYLNARSRRINAAYTALAGGAKREAINTASQQPT